MAVDGLTASERRDAVLQAHQETMESFQAALEAMQIAVKDMHRRLLVLEAKDAEPLIMVPTYSGKIQ